MGDIGSCFCWLNFGEIFGLVVADFLLWLREKLLFFLRKEK